MGENMPQTRIQRRQRILRLKDAVYRQQLAMVFQGQTPVLLGLLRNVAHGARGLRRAEASLLGRLLSGEAYQGVCRVRTLLVRPVPPAELMYPLLRPTPFSVL